jgi:hypothetical protein
MPVDTCASVVHTQPGQVMYNQPDPASERASERKRAQGGVLAAGILVRLTGLAGVVEGSEEREVSQDGTEENPIPDCVGCRQPTACGTSLVRVFPVCTPVRFAVYPWIAAVIQG